MEKIVNVPYEFCKREASPYPLTSEIEFEYWFYQKFSNELPETEWTYLPITWTELQRFATPDLKSKCQAFIDSLPKGRYFTICQHDDGILFNIKKKNILVYGSGNHNQTYYPIPLIYKTNDLRNTEKTIDFSFIGADTHPVRRELVKYFPKYVHLARYNRTQFIHMLSQSKFSLCPRGYGATSFRIMESLAVGSIPVYISDKFIEPFNIPFETYGVKVDLEDAWRIPEIIKHVDREKLMKKGEEICYNYFTYEGCYKSIIETLK